MSASPKQPDASLAIRTKDAPKQQQQQRNPQLQSTADAKPVANSSSHRNPKHRPGRKTAAEVAVASAKPLPSAAVPSAVNPTKKKKKFPRQVAGGANDGVVEKKASEPAPAPTWKLSPFLGGRYAELDPVFTKDEK